MKELLNQIKEYEACISLVKTKEACINLHTSEPAHIFEIELTIMNQMHFLIIIGEMLEILNRSRGI